MTDPASLVPRSAILIMEAELETDGVKESITNERIDTFRCTP